MKKVIICLFIFAIVSVSFQDTFPIIRSFTYGNSTFRRFDTIEVRKFEDKDAVCYVATNSFANSDKSAPQPTISCVKHNQ